MLRFSDKLASIRGVFGALDLWHLIWKQVEDEENLLNYFITFGISGVVPFI